MNAIFHLRGLNLPLNQPRLFELLEVLRDSGFRNGEHLVNVAKEATGLPQQVSPAVLAAGKRIALLMSKSPTTEKCWTAPPISFPPALAP